MSSCLYFVNNFLILKHRITRYLLISLKLVQSLHLLVPILLEICLFLTTQASHICAFASVRVFNKCASVTCNRPYENTDNACHDEHYLDYVHCLPEFCLVVASLDEGALYCGGDRREIGAALGYAVRNHGQTKIRVLTTLDRGASVLRCAV